MFLPGPSGVPLLVQLFHRAVAGEDQGTVTRPCAVSSGLNEKAGPCWPQLHQRFP